MFRTVSIIISCGILLQSTIVSAASHQELVESSRKTSLTSSKRLAQTENCLKYDRTVKPSPQTRTIALKQFGLKIQIPENYKTLLRNDGSVMILNPADYDLIACTARGGFGGRGVDSTIVIESLPNSKKLPLISLAHRKYGTGSLIESYKLSGRDGLLVQSPEGIRATYFIKIPGIDNIVQISEACACRVNSKDIKNILQLVKLL